MRTTSLLLLLVSFYAASGQSYSGDSWEQAQAQQRGTITLAYVETPSFVYRTPGGNLTGISIDILNDFVAYVKTTKNVALELKPVGTGTDFKAMYDSVKNSAGGVFGLGSVTITEERKKEVRFGPPYMTNFAILITQNTVPMLTRLEDLPSRFASFTAYVPKGTLHDKRLAELKQKYFPAMKIAYTTTGLETMEKVVADPNSFAYLDFVFYLQALQDGKSVRRHAVADKPAEYYGFIMPLNSDWSPVLEEFFSANGGYRNSPACKEILVRHLGQTGVRLLQSVK